MFRNRNTKKSDMQYLSQKSADIMSVFTKTQEDLAEVNTEINSVIASKTEEITQLQQDCAILTAISTKNTTVWNKIDNFLNT